MAFCLLPSKVEDFKKALKDKSLAIDDLIHMTTEERTAALKPYAGENAHDVNRLFEEKLVLKNRMMGIRNWASRMGKIGRYSTAGKAKMDKALSDYRAAQQERVFNPKQDEAFLNDLADQRLGVHISRDVAKKVFDLSTKAQAVKDKNPTMAGVSDEYLLARNELHDYVESQKPVSAMRSIWKNLTTIGRNHLLMNPATPIKTSVGQVVNSVMDAFTRRLAVGSVAAGNHALVSKAKAEAWATFRKTGVNVASVENGRLGDQGVEKLGEGGNFNVTANMASANPVARGAEAAVRGYAKLTNKIAIDFEHNIPFTKFYHAAFYDAANLFAKVIAKKAGLDHAEVFKDAVRIDPQTDAGREVRTAAQMQAARVTSTNKTPMSDLVMGMKKALNGQQVEVGGHQLAVDKLKGLGLGDLLIPIAKIPANVLWNGIENAGLGLPMGAWDMAAGRRLMASEDPAERIRGVTQFAHGLQTFGRTVGVLTAAALFASTLNKDDFRTDQYGGHFVKIGNLWINMEYMALVSPALAGMMQWKETGDIGAYGKGAISGYKSLPGLDAVFGFNPTGLLTSRSVPAFMGSLESDRPAQRLLFGAQGVESADQVTQDNDARAAKAAATKAAKAATETPQQRAQDKAATAAKARATRQRRALAKQQQQSAGQ